MSDYKTNSHNIYLTGSFVPTDRLSMAGIIGFNKSKAELETVIMPDITDRLDGALANLDFSFDRMHEYSNLDYEMLTLAVNGEYRLSPQVLLTVETEYADLSDNTGYVYGVETGSLVFIRTGVRFSF